MITPVRSSESDSVKAAACRNPDSDSDWNTAVMERTRKSGRRPKGPRYQITVRVPADYQPVLEEAAKHAGLPLSDYVAIVLAAHHELPVPSYTVENKNQGALPISA